MKQISIQAKKLIPSSIKVNTNITRLSGFAEKHWHIPLAVFVGLTTVWIGFSAVPEQRTRAIYDGTKVISVVLSWKKKGPKDPPGGDGVRSA